jgi:hypothetical protein
MTHRQLKLAAAYSSVTVEDREIIATMLARLKEGKDIRQAKIDRVRHAINSDDYENSLKLDVAADRMVQAIGADRPPSMILSGGNESRAEGSEDSYTGTD